MDLSVFWYKATKIKISLLFTDFYLLTQDVLCLYLWERNGKAIPLQAWTGPKGSRRVRFPDFKTIGT
jgi:hypothetical protein